MLPLLLRERHLTLVELARHSGLPLTELEQLVDGMREPSRATVEIVARALGTTASRFLEYRVDCVIDWLARRPAAADELFLTTLSPLERASVDLESFDARPLRAVVAMLCAKQELTQGELAEELGFEPRALSRVLNGHADLSVELVETIAAALGAPPEIFLPYRLAVVREWLIEHPARLDQLYADGLARVVLEPYQPWAPTPLPDPLLAEPKEVIRRFVEIVATEQPVLGARVYALLLEAAGGLDETAERRRSLNRVSYAAVRAGLLVAENEHGEPTQKYLTLRLPGGPEVRARTLGGRRLDEIPASELTEVVCGTSAWRRGEAVADVQRELLGLYGLQHPRLRELEHVNRCINLAGGGSGR